MGFGAKARVIISTFSRTSTPICQPCAGLVYNQEVKSTIYGSNRTTTVKNDLSAFYYGFNLGARYFFTNNIGAYVELGYNAVSVVNASLTVKF
jgi:hypothetical protein